MKINAHVYLPADSVQLTILPEQQESRRFSHLYQQRGIGSYLRNTVVVSTSRKQKQLESYLYLRDSLWNKYFVDQSLVEAKMIQTFDSGNRAVIEQWSDSVRRHRARFPDYLATAAALFARRYPASDITVFALEENTHQPSTQLALRPFYLALPDSLKQSSYGKLLAKNIGAVTSQENVVKTGGVE
jgi:hypothetical protein